MKTGDLELSECEKSGCGWACCKFQKDSFIILLPNELDQASSSLEHLDVFDEDYNGGKRCHCNAEDTSNCDKGYKPVHCGVYPLWMNNEQEVYRSVKCPLKDSVVSRHYKDALKVISEYKSLNKGVDIEKFFSLCDMDRYERFKV